MKKENGMVQRLREYGYNPIHLIGNFYLVRNYPKPAKKFSLYRIIHTFEPMTIIDNIPSVPEGEFRV